MSSPQPRPFPLKSLAFAAATLFAAVSARGAEWLNETFEAYAAGDIPSAVNSPLLVTASATSVIDGNGGRMVRYSKPLTTGGAGSLLYTLSPANSTPRPRGFISFKIQRNEDAGIPTGNFFNFRLGTNDSATLSADSASIISLRFYQTSSSSNLRVYSAGGAITTTKSYNPTAALQTIRIWYNDDDAATLDYVDPSGANQTLATNSFVVYLGTALITPSASGSALAGASGADLNIGKIAFNCSSTSASDMSIDDIYAADSAPSAAAPAITSPLTATAFAGIPFSYQIVADGATSFTAAPLPDGLSVNSSTGVISGTATTLGDTSVTLSATNGFALTGNATLILSVTPPAANIFTGANSSLNNTASWSFGEAPNSSTNALGSFQDLELAASVPDLTTASANLYVRSWNVINGSAYTLGSTSTASTSFRLGNTGLTDTSPFSNVVSGLANDLIYLSGNSSLTFLAENPTIGSTPSTVDLRNSGNFNIDAGSTLTVLPVIGGNAKSLTKTGAGTAILGAANTYSGGTVASAGTLVLNHPLALGTGVVTLAGGTVESNVDATLNFSTATSGAVLINGPTTLRVAADKTLVMGRVNSTATSVDNLVTKDGPGTLQLTGGGTISTVTGGYRVIDGTLFFNNSANGGAGVGPLILDGGHAKFSKGPLSDGSYTGFSLTALDVRQEATLTLDPNPLTASGANTLSFGTLTASGQSIQIVKGPNALSSADSPDYLDPSLTFFAATLSGTTTIDTGDHTSVILQSAAGTDASLVKTGPGRLALADNATTFAANTYSGPTTVSAGTLALSGSHASALSLASGTTLEFTLNGLGLPLATSSNTVSLSPGATIAIVGTPAPATTYTLLTAAAFSGTPVLASAIEGFELAFADASTLVLRPASSGTDNVAPIITLNGPSAVSVDWGSAYSDAGASATDNVDASVTVTSSGSVNTAKPGVYFITYNASDAASNDATPVIRTVTVAIADPATPGPDGLAPFLRYALGANGPSDTVELPASSSSATTLSLTAVVRTDDTGISVVGQTNTDLANPASWTSTGVTVTDAIDQSGVTGGRVRRVFTVNTSGNGKTFLRLLAATVP